MIEEEDGSVEGHSKTLHGRKQLLTWDQIRRRYGSSAWHCVACKDTRTPGGQGPSHRCAHEATPFQKLRAHYLPKVGKETSLLSAMGTCMFFFFFFFNIFWLFLYKNTNQPSPPASQHPLREDRETKNVPTSPSFSSPRNIVAFASHAKIMPPPPKVFFVSSSSLLKEALVSSFLSCQFSSFLLSLQNSQGVVVPMWKSTFSEGKLPNKMCDSICTIETPQHEQKQSIKKEKAARRNILNQHQFLQARKSL